MFRLIGRDDEQGRMAGDWLAAQRPGAADRDRPRRQHLRQGPGRCRPGARLRRTACARRCYATYPPGAEDYADLIGQLREARIGVLYVAGYGADAGADRPRRARAGQQAADGRRRRAGHGGVLGRRRRGGRRHHIHHAAHPHRQPPRRAGAGGVSRPGAGLRCPRGSAPTPRSRSWAEAAERAESLDPAEVALALHRSRFTTVLGRVAFDAKGDMAGADWQWRMWHQGGYAPLPPAMAMR